MNLIIRKSVRYFAETSEGCKGFIVFTTEDEDEEPTVYIEEGEHIYVDSNGEWYKEVHNL